MKPVGHAVDADGHRVAAGRAIRMENDEVIGLENQASFFGAGFFQGSTRPGFKGAGHAARLGGLSTLLCLSRFALASAGLSGPGGALAYRTTPRASRLSANRR